MNYDSYLESRRSEIIKDLKEIEVFLATAPEGVLEIFRRGNKIYYYQFTKKKDGPGYNKKYLKKKSNRKLIKKLALKRLYINTKRNLLNELESIDLYLNCRKKITKAADDFIGDNKELRSIMLSKNTELSDFVAEWLNEPFTPNPYKREKLIVATNDGTYVRSKSEAMIYNRLKESGLEVIYEKELKIYGKSIYPDFTILNPKTNKIYIYEHFGMLDDLKYFDKFESKIHLYIRNGYVVDNNFFMTKETQSMPFDIREVDNIINRIKNDIEIDSESVAQRSGA